MNPAQDDDKLTQRFWDAMSAVQVAEASHDWERMVLAKQTLQTAILNIFMQATPGMAKEEPGADVED